MNASERTMLVKLVTSWLVIVSVLGSVFVTTWAATLAIVSGWNYTGTGMQVVNPSGLALVAGLVAVYFVTEATADPQAKYVLHED